MSLAPLADATSAVDALNAADPALLSSAELIDGIEQLLVLETRLRAVQTRWLARAEETDATVSERGRAPRSWLVEEQCLAPADAGARMRAVHRLPLHRRLAAAFAAGTITAGHVDTILRGLEHTPAAVIDQVEGELVDLARVEPPGTVAAAVDDVLMRCGVEPNEAAEAAFARRYAQRGVDLAATFEGTGSLSGTLTAEAMETLRVALDAAAAAISDDDGADMRSARQRRHDGLREIAAFYLSAGELTAVNGERPRVYVTTTMDQLLERIRAEAPGALGQSTSLIDQAGMGRLAGQASGATIGAGIPISAATARRIACDAQIIPVVLGGDGEVLDIGRLTRTWPVAIRRAAWIRDGGRCTYPRCRRKVTELHHIRWWSRGGPTSLFNAAWICNFHHWLVHDGGWGLRRDRDTGLCVFSSPDGRQKWQQPRGPADQRLPSRVGQ